MGPPTSVPRKWPVGISRNEQLGATVEDDRRQLGKTGHDGLLQKLIKSCAEV